MFLHLFASLFITVAFCLFEQVSNAPYIAIMYLRKSNYFARHLFSTSRIRNTLLKATKQIHDVGHTLTNFNLQRFLKHFERVHTFAVYPTLFQNILQSNFHFGDMTKMQL